MGTKRLRKNTGLPPNLHPNGRYYQYQMPNGTRRGLGSDRERAIEMANKINAGMSLLNARDDALVRGILAAPPTPVAAHTINEVIAVYRAEDLPARNLGEKSAAENERKLKKISELIGERNVYSFSVTDAGDFLRAATDSTRNRQQYRYLLIGIIARAVANGWTDKAVGNVAEATIVHSKKRVRARLTVDGFKAIYQQADVWLRNAMELGLKTLLRRSDLVGLLKSDVIGGEFLRVVPGKTRESTGAALNMQMAPALKEIVQRCCDDPLLSPYLIHRLPDARKGREQRSKDRKHLTQVLPEQLTKAFRKARKAAVDAGGNPYPFCKPGEAPPTFHEIRSLGIWLYESSGVPLPMVQVMAGHADINMTKGYVKGHAPVFVNVLAGMKQLGMDPEEDAEDEEDEAAAG